MSRDFMSAFADLPAAQQRGLLALMTKFESDPAMPGLNYERVRQARDPKVHSLRVDRDYRAIVLAPRNGNIYLLLWADKHDKAYEWASRHQCQVNPETGGLQIYSPEPVERPRPERETAPAVAAFSTLRDRQLMRLGVPEAMLAEVRAIRHEPDLDAMKDRLPEEAYEGLFFYLDGEPFESIVAARESSAGEVDPDDIEKALEHSDSRSRFVLVHDEVELEKMLNAPLEKWRVFLHPSQRLTVERDWNGPLRVLGAAGTGKTVVALHRARWLARQPGAKKILFVTYNRNLATDIRRMLGQICTPEEMARIDVKNLDAWVVWFLKRHRYEFRIVYDRSRENAWKEALGFRPAELDLPERFYETEWEQVVQANGVTTLDEYKRVSRTGRGVSLNRAKRVKIWRVFEEYRLQLSRAEAKEVNDAYRDAMGLIQSEGYDPGYSSVVVDEAQDLSAHAFRLIRGIVQEGPNDLFIAGDCHQRIYGRRTVLGRCGINIRGRSRKLKLNYRTTEETRAWAARLLHGRAIDDLDGGSDSNDGIRSLTQGPEPSIRKFETFEDQAAAIVEYVKQLQRSRQETKNVCVVARIRAERDAVSAAIAGSGLASLVIDREGDDQSQPGVRIATMHRVKGLEFERVVIASANADLMPLKSVLKRSTDDSEREAAETMERALVYVAASRARKELVVMSYGDPSPFLGE